MPFQEDGCVKEWEERENTHYVGGAHFTAPISTILTPRTCLAACVFEKNCIAVDMNFGRSPTECWLFTAIANRSKSYSTANIRHYYLAKGCAPNNTTPEEDVGSGSDGGEDSGDPDPVRPAPKKPRDCKTLSWERQPGFYSVGGKRSTSKTLEQCLTGCVNDAKCQSIDFLEQGDCITHLDAADFYYVLSGPSWIQYQLISDCGKMPTKERPGKTEIKSECTRGVLKEYLMSPAAVFYDKVSSTWQCLDQCVNDKRCMAAEIHKVGRSLECYYHHKNTVFNVLQTSNDAVLYILSKQCIRLREKDLAPPRLPNPKQLSQTELGQVSKSLVERACEDFAYYDVAAPLCGYICKNEEGKQDLITIPDARFVCLVLEARNQRMSVATLLWINFCLFLAGLNLQMSLHGGRLYELPCILFKILEFLSHPPSVENQHEVNALAIVYRQCGQELCAADPAAFDSLVCNLRDAFIKGTDVQSNSILLMLIELYASNWTLKDVAKEYYGLL